MDPCLVRKPFSRATIFLAATTNAWFPILTVPPITARFLPRYPDYPPIVLFP
ncbi:UNVERIFIED_CONTAM: hypothetical protein Sradi_1433200 [Sesamum radiatum]|uniref:Uncharacterized protein n=1 Tax=Sesamum radiatum TaxID=300843 RepID=A0AAW2UUR5_SESRA